MFRPTHFVLSLLAAGILSAIGEDWDHWRGPDRNGVVSEPSGWSNGRLYAKDRAGRIVCFAIKDSDQRSEPSG